MVLFGHEVVFETIQRGGGGPFVTVKILLKHYNIRIRKSPILSTVYFTVFTYKYSVRGVGKVTIGITGSWLWSVHSDLAI